MCKGTPIKLSADFSVESLETRKEWQDTVKVLKGKDLQRRRFIQQERHLESKER